MPTTYKPKVALARKMRRTMSEPEWLLWERLRTREGNDRLNFRRQHAVGPFILDFYSAKAKLAVEVDGSHHYEEDQIEKDVSRCLSKRPRDRGLSYSGRRRVS
jgi:very-short-patch-repair endonuclease